jgi:hypothetical protein
MTKEGYQNRIRTGGSLIVQAKKAVSDIEKAAPSHISVMMSGD